MNVLMGIGEKTGLIITAEYLYLIAGMNSHILITV